MDQNRVKQFVANLPENECAAISLTRIKDDKKTGAKTFQIEFGQKLTDTKVSTASGTNFVQLAQASNPSFSPSSGCRRHWLNFMEPELKQYFPNLDMNAVSQLPIRTSSSAGPGIFIGETSPSITHNGLQKYYRICVNEVFESDANDYELNNIEKEAKKAGATGRFIKGMNPETNAVEHVFSRTLLKAATRNEDGTYTNENGWKHNEIAEYVAADNPYQDGVVVNTETGEITDAVTSLPSLS
tara:strand:- start:7483 stop:8208 length:726 start_codon:yes stop_codon:yes gene_type:complete